MSKPINANKRIIFGVTDRCEGCNKIDLVSKLHTLGWGLITANNEFSWDKYHEECLKKLINGKNEKSN